MSRSKHGSKGPGYDFWGKRAKEQRVVLVDMVDGLRNKPLELNVVD